MSENSNLRDLMDEISLCMVTTEDEGTLRSRPMDARIDREHRLLRFMTARTAAKVEELQHDKDVNVSFADNSGYRYVSLSGRSEVTTDRLLIKRLWDPSCEMWFEGDAENEPAYLIEQEDGNEVLKGHGEVRKVG